jgi:hypothetical protein
MNMDLERAHDLVKTLTKEQLEDLLLVILEEVEGHIEGRYHPMFLRAFYAGVHYKAATIIDAICDIEETFRDIIKD